MDNKMADKTVTTCASMLYALFQKKSSTNDIGGLVSTKQRKCSCLCHIYDNKKKTNTSSELKDNKFFHCKCNRDCQLSAENINISNGRKKSQKKEKKKSKKKKIVKFQIEHNTGSLTNFPSPNQQRNNLLCAFDIPSKRSPSLRKILFTQQQQRVHTQHSPKYSPGKLSLQEIRSPIKIPPFTTTNTGYSHPKQLSLKAASIPGNQKDNRPKSFYEWCIPYDNLEVGEKEAESSKGPVHTGRWHGDVMIYMRHFQSQNELETFHDEVSLLGLIRHENVVLFMGASIEPPNLAVVTSIRKGETLHTHLHVKQTAFHFGSKFSIAKQIAQGMGYLHAKGITLGKLCSRNIFLEAKVKIGITEYTMNNQPIVKDGYAYIPNGHLSYFSPEQMRTLRKRGRYLCTSERSSQKSDVYAYGTLMYEIFLGRYPFKDTIEGHILIWGVSKGHVPTVEASDFPLMFKELMQSSWKANPEQRPEFQDIITTMRKLNIPRSLQKKLSLSDSGAINKDHHLLGSPQFRTSSTQQQHWRKTSQMIQFNK